MTALDAAIAAEVPRTALDLQLRDTTTELADVEARSRATT